MLSCTIEADVYSYMQNLPVFSGHPSSLELCLMAWVALQEGMGSKALELSLRPPCRALQGTQPLAAACSVWLGLGVISQHLFQ